MKRHDLVFTDIKDSKQLKRLIWVTDLHLDAAGPNAVQDFCRLISAHEPNLVLVGGDISNGQKSLTILNRLKEFIDKPIYYVLGNHDYYFGSIPQIRKMATSSNAVTYLTHSGVFELTPRIALIGHDGWADGRAGDFLASDVLLNDYFLIQELKDLTPATRLKRLNALGDEAAAYVEQMLSKALEKYDQVIFLTHPPPFREACCYNGQRTNDNWAPHFVCLAVGEKIKPIMEKNPSKQLLVLCGHSHEAVDVNILPNLRVLVGDSTLGDPVVQGIIHIA